MTDTDRPAGFASDEHIRERHRALRTELAECEITGQTYRAGLIRDELSQLEQLATIPEEEGENRAKRTNKPTGRGNSGRGKSARGKASADPAPDDSDAPEGEPGTDGAENARPGASEALARQA